MPPHKQANVREPEASYIVGPLKGPLLDHDTESHLPYDLGRGVNLMALPDSIRAERLLVDTLKRSDPFAASLAPRLGLVYDVKALKDTEHPPRWQLGFEIHPAFVTLWKTSMALWLARPSGASPDLIVGIERYGEDISQTTPVESYRFYPHPNDRTALLKISDLEAARELNEALHAMPEAGSIWIAFLVLWQGLTQIRLNVRYLLLWVALEALFGPPDAHETTHRLTNRMAFFLAPDRTSAACIAEWATKAYRLRSKIVHGRGLKSKDAEVISELDHQAEQLVAEALRRIIRNPELRHAFADEERRSRYLEGLIFAP